MIRVKDVEQYLFDWAPLALAEDWDNVGLLVGDGEAEARKILISLDITEAVVAEGISLGADLIVAHHPIMNCTWHKVQNVKSDNPQGRMITALLKNGISAICMHTNLDAAEGGVNDILAEKLGLSDLTYLNEEKIGRVGLVKSEKSLVEFLPFVVKSLACNGLRYRDCGKPVHRVAVGGGACGDYIQNAIALGCDTFVTSDLSYHEFLDTTQLNLIDAGHFPTENVICSVMAERLRKAFPAAEVIQSTEHQSEVIQYFVKEN